MGNFLSDEELASLGLAEYGKCVQISSLAVLREPAKLHLGSHVRIDDFVTISGNVTLGDYTHIATGAGLYGSTAGIIMEGFGGVSANTLVYAATDNYTGGGLTSPVVPDKYKSPVIEKAVLFKKHALVGCNSVVLQGATLEEGASIGSMTLCNGTRYRAWTMYAGVPAKRIGTRDRTSLEMERRLREEEAKEEAL